MTVVIEKDDLLDALDNGRVRFHTDGDLTPQDVDSMLRSAADELANPNNKAEDRIDDLFDHPPKKVAVHKSSKRCHHTALRTKE